MKTAELIHAQNRLESGDITNRINYHLSWRYAPDRPSNPYNMVTRRALETRFRTLLYMDLNDYEKRCKDCWNDQTVGRGDCYKLNYWTTNLCSEWITGYIRWCVIVVLFRIIYRLGGSSQPHLYQTIPSLFLQVSSTSVASMSSYQRVAGGSQATGSALYVGRASFQVGRSRFVITIQYDNSVQ